MAGVELRAPLSSSSATKFLFPPRLQETSIFKVKHHERTNHVEPGCSTTGRTERRPGVSPGSIPRGRFRSRESVDRSHSCHAGNFHGSSGHRDRLRGSPLHRRLTVSLHRRSDVGADQLLGRQRDRVARLELVCDADRAQALLHHLCRHLYGIVVRMWSCADTGLHSDGAGIARGRGRSPATAVAVHPFRELSS